MVPYIRNYYKPVESESDFDYIQNNGKLKDLKVTLSEYINSIKDLHEVGCSLHLDFMHEMLHAYEDLERIIKSDKSVSNYQDSTNYNNYFKNRISNTDKNYKEINRLRTLFHFFNKSEIRALISQISGEIQKLNDISPLDMKNILTNTNSWKEIDSVDYSIELIKNCNDINCQMELVKIFNEHGQRAKVKNFRQLIIFLENRISYIKQYIFKKVSRIIGNIEREKLNHVIV